MCFIKNGVSEYFAKFAGKHLRRDFSSNKVAELRPAALSKRDSHTGVFLLILRKIFKNTVFTEHLRTTASVAVKKELIKLY